MTQRAALYVENQYIPQMSKTEMITLLRQLADLLERDLLTEALVIEITRTTIGIRQFTAEGFQAATTPHSHPETQRPNGQGNP